MLSPLSHKAGVQHDMSEEFSLFRLATGELYHTLSTMLHTPISYLTCQCTHTLCNTPSRSAPVLTNETCHYYFSKTQERSFHLHSYKQHHINSTYAFPAKICLPVLYPNGFYKVQGVCGGFKIVDMKLYPLLVTEL